MSEGPRRDLRKVTRRRLVAIIGASGLLVVLLGSFALVLVQHEAQAEDDLRRRYATRASLTARFVRNYLDDFATREHAAGTRLLGGPSADAASFRLVVETLGLDAAVVLDGAGVLLQVWPPKPELIGVNLADRYAHLLGAVDGRRAVSNVVPSAATNQPVVAVATPYPSPHGTRIVSGAFSVDNTPLGAYMENVSPIQGSRAFLIDAEGKSVDTGGARREAGRSALTIRVVNRLRESTGTIDVAGDEYTYARTEVRGAPWHVVLAAPSDRLYLPLGRSSWGSWLLFAAFAGSGLVAVVLLARLAQSRAEATALARTDVLTGLPNRRAVDEAFVRMAAHANRNGYRLAVLSIDLDYFKRINDTYGHRVGDQALAATGKALRAAVRAEDIVGRWGGEEFLVVLADATVPGTRRVAERLRAAITEGGAAAKIPGRLTASVGAAIDHPVNLESLLRSADDALYAAKDAGRNCLYFADETVPRITPALTTPQ